MTLRFPALLGVLLLSGVTLAEDTPRVRIVEPKDGATVVRRRLTVVAEVDSGTGVVAEISATKGTETVTKEFRLTPVDGNAGLVKGDVSLSASPWDSTLGFSPKSGKFVITVRAVDGKGKTSTVTTSLERKRARMGDKVKATGSPAPAMTVKTTKGEDLVLDSKNGPLLLHFYSAWDDCEREVKWLAECDKKYGAKGLTIVGVASVVPADYDAWTKWLAERGATWKNIPDPDGAIAKQWINWTGPIGSHADEYAVYLLDKGRVAGGESVAYEFAVGSQLESALAKLFPR